MKHITERGLAKKVVLFGGVGVVVLVLLGVVFLGGSENNRPQRDPDTFVFDSEHDPNLTCPEVYAALSEEYHQTYDDCQGAIDNEYICTDETVTQNIVLVLDSSGSMAAEVDGQQKIELAKEALLNTLGGLKESLSLSVVMYGHEGDNTPAGKAVSCAGIETIYLFGPVDQAGVASALESLAPTGFTPIADSIRHAAGVLPADAETLQNSIVVFTDGIETCDGVPDEVAGELARSEKHITTHVVGFDIIDDDARRLRAIAQSGDGEYFSVRDRDEIEHALQDIFSRSCASKPNAWSEGLSNMLDSHLDCTFRLDRESFNMTMGAAFDYVDGVCEDYVTEEQAKREARLRAQIEAAFKRADTELDKISPVSDDPFFNDPDDFE